jgi:hypothetical protein
MLRSCIGAPDGRRNNVSNGDYERPALVKAGMAAFGCSFLVFFALIAFRDRANLSPGAGDTIENTRVMFVMAHVMIVPLFALPFWGPQAFLLWNVARGRQWSRLLLLGSTLCLLVLLMINSVDRSTLLLNGTPIVMQLVGLAMLFARTSDDWFRIQR